MSQTETILLIVLQRQVPSSLVGLQTERDRLRAEYAMLSQRLGARLEAAKLQMAEHMAEVSRHRNRLHELEALEQNRGAENRRLAARVQELEFALIQSRAQEEHLRRDLAARDEALARAHQARTAHHPAPDAPHIHAAAPEDDAEARLRQRIDQLNELAKGG